MEAWEVRSEMSTKPKRDKVISKIQSSNDELNRVQDQLMRILNPLLSKMVFETEVYTSRGLPMPSSSYAGVFARVKDRTGAGTLQVCIETSTGGWEWVTVALSS